MRMSVAALPWIGGITIALLAVGLVLSLVIAPPDYQQGDSARIMFIHVPAAWMAVFIYVMLVLSGASTLIWRHPLADIAGREAAPIGAAFTLICLITGSLWGKPMWGTWWVWDARLTSVLILLFLYLGYLALASAFDEPARGARAAAVLALVGAVNIPVIKFSVDWWNTLHQPASVLRLGAPSIHISLLLPLLLMAVAFTGLFFALWFVRIRAAILARKIAVLRLVEDEQTGDLDSRCGVAAASAQ